MKPKWYHILPIFLMVGLFAFLLNFLPLNQTEPIPQNLPHIDITLNDTTLSTILTNSKEIKYPSNTLTLTEGDEVNTFDNVELKGRGNSTWGWPKSPFQIKFDQKVDLFGMGAAKKYILLANFLDKSNLRNDIAFKIEQMLDMDYALEGQFVELYIDNEYQGLYYLTEKIEIDKNRINLKDELAIIVEVENLHAATEDCYYTKENTCLVIHDLRSKDNEALAMSSFMEDFNALEQAAKAGDYDTVKDLSDLDSFAKYYLLSEFTVNPDAYTSSYFFYKNGASDKIHVSPGWDFDQSMGNRIWIWSPTEDFYSPDTPRVLERNAYGGTAYDEASDTFIEIQADTSVSRLMYYLIHIPMFAQKVSDIYRQYLAGHKDTFLRQLAITSSTIYKSAIEDKEKWRATDPIVLHNLGLLEKPLSVTELLDEDSVFTPQQEIVDDAEDDILHSGFSAKEAYDTELNNLFNWVSRRFDYLEREYGTYNLLPLNVVKS